MNIAEAKNAVILRASQLSVPASVNELVDIAFKVEEEANDVEGFIQAGALWRKVAEVVPDDRARALASMRIRKCQNMIVCAAVKVEVDAELGEGV